MFKSEKIVRPYSRLAEIYDNVMDHVDYEKWAHYIVKIVRTYRLDAKEILDISCGTGSLCFALEKLGYQPYGSDSAYLMVRQAKRNAHIHQKRSRFWCADMSTFRVDKKFELIVSLYDSMNYLIPEEHWLACFKSVSKSLAKNGLFVFDISTVKNSLNYFNSFVHRNKIPQGRYKRQSHFDRENNIQTNIFKIFFHRIPELIFIEEHRQRIRTLQEVVALIERSPLKLVDHYDDFNFQKGSENSDRIHFVLTQDSP